MKLCFYIVTLLSIATLAHADKNKAAIYCSVDDDQKDKVLVQDRITSELVLDTSDKNATYKTSEFSVPYLNNRKFIMYMQYIGAIGKPEAVNGANPVDLFQISLYDVEKQIYASSVGEAYEKHYTSFVYPDRKMIFAFCYVQILN